MLLTTFSHLQLLASGVASFKFHLSADTFDFYLLQKFSPKVCFGGGFKMSV
jgi:hypothetical protein